MALNSPLLQSLVDKINYKQIIELNTIRNIPYFNIGTNNHNQSDPIYELFIILWKCYTIYYQLFNNVEKCSDISKYNVIINKIIDNDEVLLKPTITHIIKKQKIEELDKLIKRFKYLKNIIVNKKEKVQINNLWDMKLNKYPFSRVNDSHLIKNPADISEVTGYNSDVFKPHNGMLMFMVDKKSSNLLLHVLKRYDDYYVYNNDNISSNDIIRQIYDIIRHKVQIKYKQNIPLLILHKDYKKIFIELYKVMHEIRHYFINSTFMEFLDINKFTETCDIYYLNIPDINKYNTEISEFDNIYKDKLITYYNEVITPYNVEAETASLSLNITNMVSAIHLDITIGKNSNSINKVKYKQLIKNLYEIYRKIYECKFISNNYKNIILKYIKRLLINKVYKKQFNDNLYNYLDSVYNKLLNIATKYKLCNNI